MNNPHLSKLYESIEKPNPQFFSKPLNPFLASTPNRTAFENVKRGTNFCFEGTFGTAMSFYSWVKKQVNLAYPITDYQSSRINREELREYTQRLFVRIKNQNIDLANGPQIPWLQEFYSNINEFYLPFTDVLGMNGAWQWWRNGIQFPGLENKLHPFFGVYLPTRIDHLTLFDTWLSAAKPHGKAMDLGTGCGVLTFYMLKHGISDIIASDLNPNALYSLGLELERLNLQRFVRLEQANFFEDINTVDLGLVVFNPPWIPENPTNTIDLAMYYQPDYFKTFFKQAAVSLPSGCKLVMLYSTFAQVVGITKSHPIEDELSISDRFKLIQKIEQPVIQKPSPKKNWLSTIRAKEKVELWELIKQ